MSTISGPTGFVSPMDTACVVPSRTTPRASKFETVHHEAADDDVDVTVEFTCADTLSGVRTCPLKETVATDGAGQSVRGEAEDWAGNSATATIEGINIDRVPPVVSCPANQAVDTDPGRAAATLTYSLTAKDNNPGVVSAGSPASGWSFPVGVTTVNATATDIASNTASCSFTVTVRDTEPPVLTVPSDITVDATSPAGAAVTFAASATDNVDGVLAVSCVPASQSTFPIGSSGVACSAQDAAGNAGTESFTVHVRSAAEQTANLLAAVVNVGAGPAASLASKLRNASAAIAKGDANAACGELRAFQNQVRAQAGKSVPAGLAVELRRQRIARARRLDVGRLREGHGS